jgi:integrase
LMVAHLSDFDALPIRKIDAARLAAKKAQLMEKGLEPKTVNNVISVIITALKCAVEWGELDSVPVCKLLRFQKKKMPFLSTEIYDRQVAGAVLLKDKRALALILLAGDGGMRKGEIIALDWSCVDLARRMIAVEKSEVDGIVTPTKGLNWRMVPMTDSLRAALTALPHRTGRVIRGRSAHGGVNGKTLGALVKEAELAAGLEETGKLHILRHSYASHLAGLGQSLYHLQAALGHQDHATTQGYAKLHGEALRPLATAINSRRIEAAKGQALLEAGKVLEMQEKVVEAVGIEPSFSGSGQDPENKEKPS